MKTKLLAAVLLAGSLTGGALFAAPAVAVGIGVGVPAYGPPPPAPTAYVAPAPGPGYAWVGGAYYPYRGRWAWRAGYWGRRPYAGAYWAAPRFYGHRYYRGYWRR